MNEIRSVKNRLRKSAETLANRLGFVRKHSPIPVAHDRRSGDSWFPRSARSKAAAVGGALVILTAGVILGNVTRGNNAPAVDNSTVELKNASTFLQCHDNTTAAVHVGHWTHGDPNIGLPGDPSGGNGYYYLSITACGPLVYGEVYSPDPRSSNASTYKWDIDISPGYDHLTELAAATWTGAGGRVYITNAIPGAQYRLRVANISTSTHADYAEFNSGPVGGTDADCGGPGIVRDPNTGTAPVEPAPQPGFPANSCAKGSGTIPFPGTGTPTPIVTPTPTGSSSSSSSQSSSSSSSQSSTSLTSSSSSSSSTTSASTFACVVLKDGKMVVETCTGTHT